jgi:hypothetical protein
LKKKNIIVIGNGTWGKKIINVLKKHSKIVKIINSKDNYKDQHINLSNIDWVFVLTPVQTHFNIVKYFLEKKLNVFCEKPLSNSFKSAKKLISLSKKVSKILYVSDVENYKNLNVKFGKTNIVLRFKKDIIKKESIFFRLFYHDLYILYNQVKRRIVRILIYKKSIFEVEFEVFFLKKSFLFHYKLDSNKKVHMINDTNFLKFSGNPLNSMLKKVLFLKNKQKVNNNAALNAIKLINKIE